MSEPLAAAAPMPFRLLLDEAMRWTRRHFRSVYPPIAIPLAVIVTLTGVGQALLMPNMTMNSDPMVVLRRMGFLMIMVLPLALLGGIAHAALQVGTVDTVAGRGPDMAKAWRFIFRPSAFSTLLLLFLCYMGAVMCCVIPVFYFGPLLAFAIPAMVDEGRFGTDALSRSSQLTRFNPEGRFLSNPIVQILAVGILTAILEYAVSFIIAMPLTAVQMVSVFRRAAAGEMVTGVSGGWLWAQVVVQLISSLLNTAVTVYASFIIALLFFEVRRRREATDLRGAIDAMAPAPQPPPLPPPPPLPLP
jgi:hypothetical protein